MNIRRYGAGLVLGGMLFGAFALRFALAYFVFTSTRDTSTVGIMALQILEGARPLYYAGQAYMGALEAYAVAVVFRLFGVSATTLTLAPILFALGWITAVFMLFRRVTGSLAGGAAAAACAAFGGYYTVWYTMGAYGGYPGMLLFGTAALVLALRLTQDREPTVRWPWWALGLTFALGIWTNMQSLPFFMVAWFWLLADWALGRRDRRQLMMIVGSGAIGLLGFLPKWTVWDLVVSGRENDVSEIVLSAVGSHFYTFWHRNLPELFFWPNEAGPVVVPILLIVCSGLPMLYYLGALRRVRQQPAWLIPLLFTVFYMTLYFLHPMSALSAPRYLISPFTMMVGAGFASMVCAPRRPVRVAGLLMLTLWCSVNVLGVADKIRRSSAQKIQSLEDRQSTIDAAREMGMHHVKMIGALPDQLRGIVLSFMSQREVRFLAMQDDRILEHHLGWARDESAGYAFPAGLRSYFDGALQAMNVRESDLRITPEYALLGNLQPAHAQRSLAPIKRIMIEGLDGQGEHLMDWTRSTGVSPTSETQRLTIELEGMRRVDGMRFFPVGEELPRGPYDLEVSRDGVMYHALVTNLKRTGESYVSGNRIYFKDYEPAQDHRWPPVEAAYVRMTIRGGSQHAWALAEAVVFEHVSERGPIEESEVQNIEAWLQAQGMTFCWADRWMSSHLQGTASLPPPNIRYPETLPSRHIPCRPDQAICVESSMADEAARLLAASLPAGVTVQTHAFDAYTLLSLAGAFAPDAELSPPLIWNGHTLLRP